MGEEGRKKEITGFGEDGHGSWCTSYLPQTPSITSLAQHIPTRPHLDPIVITRPKVVNRISTKSKNGTNTANSAKKSTPHPLPPRPPHPQPTPPQKHPLPSPSQSQTPTRTQTPHPNSSPPSPPPQNSNPTPWPPQCGKQAPKQPRKQAMRKR